MHFHSIHVKCSEVTSCQHMRVALSLGSSLIIYQAHHHSCTSQNSKLLVYNKTGFSSEPWTRTFVLTHSASKDSCTYTLRTSLATLPCTYHPLLLFSCLVTFFCLLLLLFSCPTSSELLEHRDQVYFYFSNPVPIVCVEWMNSMSPEETWHIIKS